MDEQTMPQPEYDIASDGAANSGYEGEASQSAGQEIATDGVKESDGELKFGDEFFGDLKDSPDETPDPPAPDWKTRTTLTHTRENIAVR